MNQNQIKAKAKKLQERMRKLRAEERLIQAEWQNLQADCSHPEMYTKSHYDGSTSEKCDDCGYSF